MPVHDKQMPDTGLVWTRVAPMKWRKIAPATSPSAAEVAIVHPAKRARTLTVNNKTVADFTNWLDFLQHMDHDAYVTLMGDFVRVEALECDSYLKGRGTHRETIWTPICAGENPYRGHPCSHPYGFKCDINLYGLQYRTEEYEDLKEYIGEYDEYADEDSFESVVRIHQLDEDLVRKQNLLVAAEANGVKVYKSWSKPRIWKALLSA
jgi:hypothetical protein